jgi:hypothetical protein
VLTVAQFGALVTPEGTKGTLAPDEVYLEVDAANGIQWHLAFESGETTYKWRFLGGPPLFSEVAGGAAVASAAYVDLGGPSVTLPRSGDYDVEVGFDLVTTTAGDQGTWCSYAIGGTGAVDADAASTGLAAIQGGPGTVGPRPRRKTGLTPVALTAKGRGGSAQSRTLSNRTLKVTPVRVRHDA